MILLSACVENELIGKDEDPTGSSTTAAPDIFVDPPSIDFGLVDPDTVAEASLNIANVGDASLLLRELGSGSTEVSWTSLSSPAIAPGASVDLVLSWDPVSGEPLADRLRIESSDPDEQFTDVALSGELPAPEILVEPDGYDFGDLDVGSSASTTFTVSNVGAGPLQVSDFTFSATDADMSLIDAGAFTSLPATLDPGESTTLLLQYAPSAAGADEASFEVFSNDPETPGAGAGAWGNGVEDDPCDGFTQTMGLMLTADDAWQAWMDGVEFNGANQNNWMMSDSFEWEMECGEHTLAIYATDVSNVIAGVIAVITVEGTVTFVSEPDNWSIIDSMPAGDWTAVGYDDSAWKVPEVCGDTSPWGSTPQPFYDQGAQWIWWTSACRDLGEAWLRLDFTVP